MNAKIIKKEKNIVSFEMTAPRADFDKACSKAYYKLRGQIAIPGFRKGKAPRHLIERMYGKSVFYDEAIETVLETLYPETLKELDINPINRPTVDVNEIKDGEDVVVSVDVEVMPEVSLGDYKGIEVEKVAYPVTDEAVDAALEAEREKNARIIDVDDRAVKDGDILTIDYAGFCDGNQFEGGTAEKQTLEIGSNKFIPGFEEQLVGKNLNEEVEINVTFPEDYNAEELKGKDATFKVTVHEIKEKQLPELDDEFVTEISEFDTIDELKADYRKKLEEEAANREKVENDNKLVEIVVNNAEVEVPEVLVEREIEQQANNYRQQFMQQGFSGKEMEGFINSLVDQYRNQYRDQAVFNVKADLVINAIIDQEQINATDEELEKELETMYEAYGVEEAKKEEFKSSVFEPHKHYFVESVTKRKAFELLRNEAKFVEK